MLLDAVGDSDVPSSGNDGSELLVRLLQSGATNRNFDPTEVSNLPQMEIDQWSSEDQIEEERKKKKEEILENKKKTEEDLNIEFGGTIDETLANHGKFTLGLLERLCNVIGEAGTFAEMPEVINALTKAKDLHSEKLLLTDRITKLTAETVNLQSQIQICDNRRRKSERDLDRMSVARVDEEHRGENVARISSSSGDGHELKSSDNVTQEGITNGTPMSAETEEFMKAAEKELSRKISILENQLAKSEADKAKAEMELTLRVAQPLSQQESLVAHLKKTVDDLRQQCKKLVTVHNTSNLGSIEKMSNLEIGMQVLESTTSNKIQEIVKQTVAKIKAVEEEKKTLQSNLLSTKAELSIQEQLNSQIGEYESLDVSSKSESGNLRKRIKSLAENQNILKKHVEASRNREEKLEALLVNSKGFKFDKTKDEPLKLEDVNVDDIWDDKGSPKAESDEVVNEDSTTSIKSCQQRSKDLQEELNQSEGSINELILEIEDIAAQEIKCREQSARTLKMMNENKSTSSSTIEEKMRLQQQMTDIQKQRSDLEAKLDAMTRVVKQQEMVINQLIGSEQKVKAELVQQKTIQAGMQNRIKEAELSIVEADQKRSLAEQKSVSTGKRNGELLERCKQISAKHDAERKNRMVAQREAQAPKNERDNSEPGGADEMLKLTLKMLKCSVCRDRFKEVTITRCYHLFCKECIDTNLANRHRKCPACGEKFGADDVQKIYLDD